MSIGLQIDAARTNRSLVPSPGQRGSAPSLGKQFWRRLIFSAVHDAKRTRCGVPTDCAILARWWIAEHQPSQNDQSEWERSFNGSCNHLDCDPGELRKKLLAQIDVCLKQAYELHVQSYVYFRRAMVLTCAGIPTAIARQYALSMADQDDYEDVAGVDYGDQYAMYDQRVATAA